MNDRIITARDLATELGVSEIALHNIAHATQLPLTFSTFGWFTTRDTLDRSKQATNQKES